MSKNLDKTIYKWYLNLSNFNSVRKAMRKDELKHFQKLLLEEREEVVAEIMESDEDARNLMENDMINVNDSVDEATSTITQTILSTMSKNNQQKILAIEAALRRIVENNYGLCIACGCKIAKERLEAVPWATKCITCKLKENKKHHK